MTRRRQRVVCAARSGRRRRPGVCASRGCGLPGHYAVSRERSMCAVHAAVTLLARAISEALAADNATGRR